jgi:hypothetical protein
MVQDPYPEREGNPGDRPGSSGHGRFHVTPRAKKNNKQAKCIHPGRSVSKEEVRKKTYHERRYEIRGKIRHACPGLVSKTEFGSFQGTPWPRLLETRKREI